MKKTSKILKIVSSMTMGVALFGCNGKVHAADPDIFAAAKTWIDNGKNNQPSNASIDFFVGKLLPVGQLLVGFAIATLVIVSVIMAIRWITATPDKKAKLQQQLIGLVVATFVIFGAVGIWNLVRGIMTNVETTLEANTNQEVIVVANNENAIK